MKYTTKIITSFLLAILCGLSCVGQSKNSSAQEKKQLKKLFYDWEKEQIKSGKFLASEYCNPQWISDHEDTAVDWSIPEDDIGFSFADLNGDHITDCLVTFIPDQCDGGNAGMWTQLQIFILSTQKGYQIIDTLDVEKFKGADLKDGGFYWLDRIGPHKMFGRYFKFFEDDGHCCPHVRKVIFDFKQKRLIYFSSYYTE